MKLGTDVVVMLTNKNMEKNYEESRGWGCSEDHSDGYSNVHTTGKLAADAMPHMFCPMIMFMYPLLPQLVPQLEGKKRLVNIYERFFKYSCTNTSNFTI